MRKTLLGILLVAAIGLNSCLIPVPVEKKSGNGDEEDVLTGEVSGMVLSTYIENNQVKTEPYVPPDYDISNSAEVRIIGTDFWTRTNSEGDYAFQEIPEGTYEIQAGAEGWSESLAYPTDTKTIFVKPNQVNEIEDLVLVTEPILKGKIKFQNGSSFANKAVTSHYSTSISGCSSPDLPVVSSTTTSSDGSYALLKPLLFATCLKSNGYSIRFNKNNSEGMFFEDEYKIFEEDATAFPM
ncbi:carboxypeptidase regulatory-like domain-containing protein [Candidatus Pacearchaeota archaeon]|nr:carboxypeptidase regulatory-like domain-containing protein [Candidatus Pacearchaeota archaeon]